MPYKRNPYKVTYHASGSGDYTPMPPEKNKRCYSTLETKFE